MVSSNQQNFRVETSSDVSKLLNVDEKEEMLTHFDNVTLVYNESNHGEGKLYLTNLGLIWLNSRVNDFSYSFPYKYMMFHALSRDMKLFKRPCILIQLNSTNDEDDNQTVLLAPTDFTVLESLFDHISKFSTLVDPPVEDDIDCEIYEEP